MCLILNFVELNRLFLILISVVTLTCNVFSQENDTLPFQLFKERLVLSADIGYHSAPFSLDDNYGLGVSKLKYRNNVKLALGIGINYKWLGIRFGFSLPGNILSTSKYGETTYFDGGLKFNIKRTHFAIDLRSFTGYAIKDAYIWNDTLSSEIPNDIRPLTTSISFSINSWWFFKKQFNIRAIEGKTGQFTDASKTWYVKTTLNFYGVGNNAGKLVPTELVDSSARINAMSIGAIDFGFIPGYAYGNSFNSWQIGLFAGLGPVIQGQFYAGDVDRGFLAFTPRIDLRLMLGYSKPLYFVHLKGEFDIKSVDMQDLLFIQSFYNVNLVGGIRIPTKKSRIAEGLPPRQK